MEDHRIENKNKKKSFKKVILSLVVVVLCLLFYAGGYTFGKLSEGKINFKVDPDLYKQTKLTSMFQGKLIEQVWTILKTDFVDQEKIDEKELYYGALKGFVSGVGDPYTVLFDPETSKEFEDQISGKFEGIGAEIGLRDGVVTIIAPLPGTPAENAGLKAGDKVYSVDSLEVIGMSLDKVVRLIRGAKGTEVTLLIVSGNEEPRDVVITRGVIELDSVKWEFRDDGIAYVELSSFNGDTVEQFDNFIKELKQKSPKGMILDLRNNPGGLLDTALDISSYWIEDELLLIEKFGDGREIEYKAGNKAALKNIKTVVLINEGSASGSEIVAGALQDYEIADILGEKSFGKGSVQALKKLPDGSSLKVTIAKWLTPKGNSINDEGITPNVEVDMTPQDYVDEKDPQLEKALELLR